MIAATWPIQVLLADIGLSGINGFQLAERIENILPTLRTIYVGRVGENLGDRDVVVLPEPIDFPGSNRSGPPH